jgi:hypothetical protein
MAHIFIYSINNKKISTDVGPEGMKRILKIYKQEVDSAEFNLLSFIGWYSSEFGRIDTVQEIVLFEVE